MGRGLLAGRSAARTAFAVVAGILIVATVGSAPALTATHRSNPAPGPTFTIDITGPAAVRAGDEIMFTVHPYAAVPVDATNVVVTVPVPAGTTFWSAAQEAPSGDQPVFTCTNPARGATGTVSCITATMLNGVGAAFDLDFHVPLGTANGTTVHTTATVTADNATPVSNTLDTYIGGADLYVGVSGSNRAPAGARLTDTILVQNAGPEGATGVSLVVWVPAATTLVSVTQSGGSAFTCIAPTVDGGVRITCTTAAFASGASAQFDVVLLVGHSGLHPPAASMAVSPSVSAATPDPDLSNNSSNLPTSLHDAGAPSAVTYNDPDSFTATSATIRCSVEYDSIPTTFVIEYGTTSSYGSSTAAADVTESHPAADLTGLAPSTQYFYRCVATNFAGVSQGMGQAFTTLAGTPTVAPAVTTSDASGMSTTRATLHGTVNPNGAATAYEFEYGATTVYGASTGATSVGSGSADVGVSEDLSALSPATTYHYRLVATSVAGTTRGDDHSFTTPAAVPIAPEVETWSASDVAATAADIAGTFNPNGFSTTYWFEFGTTTAYGNTYTLPDVVVSGWDSVTVRLYDLQPSTTYHYRLVASNAAGTVNGGDLTFTTAAAPPAATGTETPPLLVTQQAGALTEALIAAGRSGSLTLTTPSGTPAPSMSWGADTFPAGTVVSAETFLSTSDSTPPVLNGFAVGSLGVELDFTSGGTDLHAFAAPLEIVFPNAAANLVPSYSNDEGLTWTAIPLLSGTTLPDGQADGYFRDAAGAIHILTRHATYYGMIGGLVLHSGNRPTFPVGSKRIFVYLAPERPAGATVTLATRQGKPLRTLKLNLPATTTRLKIPLPHGLHAGLYLVQVAATSGPASTKTTLVVRLVGTRHR